MTWVNLAHFDQMFEAEMARMRLEAEGIPARILDAQVASMLNAGGMGIVRLQVEARNMPAASALLQAFREGETTGAEPGA